MTTKRLGPSYHKLFISTVISNIGDGMSLIAYPWLASALTRNPLLISGVVLVQRLPWLIFTLPAGVITDRVDRKRAMVVADFARFAITLVVALAVFSRQSTLPGVDDLSSVTGTATGLYILLLVATLLLGTAEVLRDNCGQTFMPSIVEVDQLEKANGRMWSAETIANTFIGPPLGSLLLLVAFALPFFVDAASFFAAAALVAAIPGTFRADRPDDHVQAPWRSELAEGFRWLWANELLRSMAIILGFMNLASTLSGSVLVLFSQEILGIGPLVFTIMGFGFAAGAAIGGYLAPWMSKRLGSGTCLAMTLGSSAAMSFLIGLSSWWPVVMVLFAIGSTLGRDLERDHGQPSTIDHPVAPPGPGQQRLPLLCLGDDAARRTARRPHRHRRQRVRQPRGRIAFGLLRRLGDLLLPVHRRSQQADHRQARSGQSDGACLSSPRRTIRTVNLQHEGVDSHAARRNISANSPSSPSGPRRSCRCSTKRPSSPMSRASCRPRSWPRCTARGC